MCANAAMAIATVTDCSPKKGFEKAMESLMSGKANEVFKRLQRLSSK